MPVRCEVLTPVSPPVCPSDWYRPCLPQRGCPSEPHYSVPRNNARVHMDTSLDTRGESSVKLEEVDKTPTNEAGRMLETLEKVRQFL